MNRNTCIFLILVSIAIWLLGYMSIQHSYSLGVKDKYGVGVILGYWLILGGVTLLVPFLQRLKPSVGLKWFFTPIMLWLTSPFILVILMFIARP